jgi:NAD-dependent deacetylase
MTALAAPADGSRVVVLSGSGLSAASDIPAWRDASGTWDGRPVAAVASIEGWQRDPELVGRLYDQRRLDCAPVFPNAAHEALVRLQHRWGSRRVVLASQALDGLLHKAGAVDVIELYGTIWQLRCEVHPEHPHAQLAGPVTRPRRCSVCKAAMRPDVVWPGEPIRGRDRLIAAVNGCAVFVAVGANSLSEEGSFEHHLYSMARVTARMIEINVRPSGAAFDVVLAEPADEVVPRLVASWLGERVSEREAER